MADKTLNTCAKFIIMASKFRVAVLVNRFFTLEHGLPVIPMHAPHLMLGLSESEHIETLNTGKDTHQTFSPKAQTLGSQAVSF